MSYPYSFKAEYPDFDSLRAMWDKNEESYKITQKVLEEQGKILSKEVEKKIEIQKQQLVWDFIIENHADGWKTIVKTCVSDKEHQKGLGDFCKTRISTRFKIIENKYLIVGQPIGNTYRFTTALDISKNGMILSEEIVSQISSDIVPVSNEWRFASYRM